tara:strand:+ start:369 stop:527 length:159 start_codon:yes stop_codon:yes gene_type:complete
MKKMNKIKMAAEVMEALQFLHGESYGEKFNELRKTMSLSEIHEMLGKELAGE